MSVAVLSGTVRGCREFTEGLKGNNKTVVSGVSSNTEEKWTKPVDALPPALITSVQTGPAACRALHDPSPPLLSPLPLLLSISSGTQCV